MRLEDRLIADGIQDLLVLPPGEASDVCPGCSSWRNPNESWCPNCQISRAMLPSVCRIVIPASIYARPSVFRDIVSHYKTRPDTADGSFDILPANTSQVYCIHHVRVILNRFLIEILPLLMAQGLNWDFLTVVPSRWRTEAHPLAQLLRAIEVGEVRECLVSDRDAVLQHGRPNERAFHVSSSVAGQSVLLIDDVFTTGASIHSAAAALEAAAANVVAGIVIARRVRPEYNEHSHSLWVRQSAVAFDWQVAAETGAARTHGRSKC
jgi:adenine/guanine phosphoribosyltransferase-like PRPP-binding protein